MVWENTRQYEKAEYKTAYKLIQLYEISFQLCETSERKYLQMLVVRCFGLYKYG